MTIIDVLLISSGTLTALIAGLFFGFSVAVIGGLRQLQDLEYVRAMKSINQVILNPLFFIAFFGPVILLPVVTFLQRDAKPPRFLYLLLASMLYVFGAFILTLTGNVPLNQKLARFKITKATESDIAAARAKFEGPWNRLHLLRTIASVAATVLVFLACLAAD